MIVRILAEVDGRLAPLTLCATQVVVYQDNGTPIAAAAEYGMENSQAVAKAGDADFNTLLRNLGVEQRVVCDTLELPKPPPGARLIAGPDVGGSHGR